MHEVETIPHSPGCEKSVLSTLINTPERADDAPELSENHFHLPGHRILHRYLMRQIHGGGIDTTLLLQQLQEGGDLERIGGASVLADVYTYAPSDIHFLRHVAELGRFLAYRKTITAADSMRQAAMQREEVGAILSVTSEPITEIQDLLTGASSRSMSKGMVMEEALTRFESKCRGETSPLGIETSLDTFNEDFKGLHPKKTIVISAYPGGGKTTLATQLCLDAAFQGANVLICSLEMPQVDIMDRMLAYASNQPIDAVIDPIAYCQRRFGSNQPTKGLLQAIGKGIAQIKDAKLEIEDMVASDVHQIAAVIRRAHRKQRLDVVAVDYAQRIRPTPDQARNSREQQLSYSSNLLADLAKELSFTLLLPSQLNKQGAAKHAEAINEDADIHCRIMQNDDKEHIGIQVEKNRGGQSGQILANVLDGAMCRFVAKQM
jgi:replicative DNA helicase